MKHRRRLLRSNLTEAEKILWSCLKDKKLSGRYKFRRQYSVGYYVIDFYCPEQKLAVEVDGDSHAGVERIEYDTMRQKLIEDFGIRFLRFTNIEVKSHLTRVLKIIASPYQGEVRRPPIGDGGGGVKAM